MKIELQAIIEASDYYAVGSLLGAWENRLKQHAQAFYQMPVSYRSSEIGRCQAQSLHEAQRAIHAARDNFHQLFEIVG